MPSMIITDPALTVLQMSIDGAVERSRRFKHWGRRNGSAAAPVEQGYRPSLSPSSSPTDAEFGTRRPGSVETGGMHAYAQPRARNQSHR